MFKKYLLLLPLLFSVTVSAQTLLVDDFESYVDDIDVEENWAFSLAGGEMGLFHYLETSDAPQGSNYLWIDADLLVKWWHNRIRKTFPNGAINVADYKNVDLMFRGDETADPVNLVFVVYLYDSRNRGIKFSIPGITNPEWRKVTLSLDSFSEEEWDDGYGTAEPDADRTDIVALSLVVIGDQDNQVGSFGVDNIRLTNDQSALSVTGSITQDGQPVNNVKVLAYDQTSKYQATTDANGNYSFDSFEQGKQYRLVPVAADYAFSPAAQTVISFDVAYAQDFSAIASPYQSLENAVITDPFDEGGVNSNIVYRGSRQWRDGEAGDTRPVISVHDDIYFTVNFPESEGVETMMGPIEPNTLDGATSPDYALEVGGFYSWDMLAFGQDADTNYFAEVDAYLEMRDDTPETMFDQVSLGIHCSIFNPHIVSLDAFGDTNSNGSSGGYALTFESDTGKIIARKYAPNNANTYVLNRIAGYAQDFAETTMTESGWHRLRVEYLDGTITFSVDGSVLAEVQDSSYPFGPAGLHYRAAYNDTLENMSLMHHARFDNLKAGPSASSVSDWMLN
ncbi:MAG: carboxypeptidase-like regulatory domain-containing protein [Candidatus Hinthialibacter antarcticus]|nr:carboxypeptidase-like regulatory domain-containing protein [Candidatus Hinthialibacter antarcticus]